MSELVRLFIYFFHYSEHYFKIISKYDFSTLIEYKNRRNLYPLYVTIMKSNKKFILEYENNKLKYEC